MNGIYYTYYIISSKNNKDYEKYPILLYYFKLLMVINIYIEKLEN